MTSSDDDKPQPDEQPRARARSVDDEKPEDPNDRWLREQRPPHWE